MGTRHTADAERLSRAPEEKAELERVLSSGIFAKAPNLAKLLAYICDQYWQGEIDSVKEYRLGVEALGRPANFDPSSNAIVRVEAHRLREKLRKYYEGEGASHELAISLQPGRYAPQFIARVNASESKAVLATPAAEAPSRRWPAWAVAGAIAAVLAVVLVVRYSGARAVPSPRAKPKVARLFRTPLTPPPKPAMAVASSGVRIRAGYVGRGLRGAAADGWSSDQDYSGGYARASASGLILRAVDPALFSTSRMGDFSYNIPLKPGDYQLWLYFAETFFGPGTQAGGGAASRSFDVQANGRTLLHQFDIISDAGGNFIGDVRVFKDIHPAPDGYLHLVFVRESGDPLINAIRIEPGTPGKLLPIHIVAQNAPYTGPQGTRWSRDRYFVGGRLTHYLPLDSVSAAGLYAGERYGSFNYAIPVAPGKYAVTLYFCEHYFGPDEPGGGGIGSRVFNVFSDGTTLLKSFDIFKRAGGWGRPFSITFHGMEPNPQGKIDLQFEPITNYPLINAISVVDESRSTAAP